MPRIPPGITNSLGWAHKKWKCGNTATMWERIASAGLLKTGDVLTHRLVDASKYRLEVVAPAAGTTAPRLQSVEVATCSVKYAPSTDFCSILRCIAADTGRAAEFKGRSFYNELKRDGVGVYVKYRKLRKTD